ncbi:sortase [Streptomyces sp. NPDC021100]|uniref:sortase n=1 Tax=Streptomyces sp. NPDC021100 TaxID=3365114 RepID=UPI003788D36D
MPENSRPADIPPLSRPARHTRRNALIGAGIAVTIATGLTAALWPGSDRAAETKPAAPHSTAPGTSPSARLSAAAGPASSSPAPNPMATEPDRTGTAHAEAGKALQSWRETNPHPAAEGGQHAVGRSDTPGGGGQIQDVVRIPALGADWAQPVYEGVGDRQLKAGIGHFPYSQQPGDTGNFAVAGHRSGVSDPAFRNIDNLKTGSEIRVTTANRTTFVYAVTKISTVAPTDVNVTAPVPGHPDQVATQKKMTIVTCWPATGHSKRVVIEADLIAARGGVR